MLDVARLEGEAAAGALAAFRLGEPPFARAGADAGAAVVARDTRGMIARAFCRATGAAAGVGE